MVPASLRGEEARTHIAVLFLSWWPTSPHKQRGSSAHPALGGQGREGLETEGQDRTEDLTQTTSSKPLMVGNDRSQVDQ